MAALNGIENEPQIIREAPTTVVPNESDQFSISPRYLTQAVVEPAISTSSAQVQAAPAQDPAQIVGSTQFQQAIAMAKELMPPATPFNPALASLLYFTKMGEQPLRRGQVCLVQ